VPTDSVFTGSIIVNRPIMEVFDYARDPNKIYEWHPFHSKLEEVERGENILSFEITYSRLISPLTPTFRVDLTEMVLGRRLVYRCLKGGVVFTIDCEPSSRGTVIYSSMSLWSWQAVLLEFTVPLSRPFFNDWIAQSLANFKRNAEGKDSKNDAFVFYSYRREAMYTGGRIYDALLQEFGEGFVFRDIDSISGGSQWQMRIEEALKKCKIVIAHIDDDWEGVIKDKINEVDVLREELNTTLLYKDKIFIPVFTSHQQNFVMGNRLAKIHETLNDISSDVNSEAAKINHIKEALKNTQGLLLRRDPDFRQDCQKLLETVWAIRRETSADPTLRPRSRPDAAEGRAGRPMRVDPSRRVTRPPRPRSPGDASSARRRPSP